MLEYCDEAGGQALDIQTVQWQTLVAETPLQPHARHVFDDIEPRTATHVRLHIYPDGGVARLRVFGRATPS